MNRSTSFAKVAHVNGIELANWDRSGMTHHRLAILPGLRRE